MNFGFTEEQELLRKTARDFLAQQVPMKHVREVLEGPETYSRAVWSGMAELGWTGLALPESHGGAGLGMIELVVLLEELGRSLAPVPLLPTAIAADVVQSCGSDAQRAEWLPKIAAGDAIATLALAEEGHVVEPEGAELEARPSGKGWMLRGAKTFVPDAASAHLLVVVARTEDGDIALFALPRETPGVSLAPLRSMDLLRPLYRVELDGVRVPSGALLGDGPDAGVRFRSSLDRALVMIAAEMVGGAERCLETAVAYAKERVQFGKPIGVNQAIKHKCADMLFQVESAKSIAHYAAWAAREQHEEAPIAAAMAKAFVGDAYCRAAAENLQIHGGVGFTWEYDCHLYLKRARSDEAWLGGSHHHRERVASLLPLESR